MAHNNIQIGEHIHHRPIHLVNFLIVWFEVALNII
jgi:hypothetical protein